MTTLEFSDLGLAEPLQRALAARGYETPTPIQAKAIPVLLQGGDVLGIAQTGTGKTAAFALPILERLNGARRAGRGAKPMALILAPTRELAIQIGDEIKTYAKHVNCRQTVIFGGVKQHAQVQALRNGLDILVATPGRLLDLIQQGHARLDAVEVLVLDEADRMFDMGFIRDVRKIVAALPKVRQSLLFSATMPDNIAKLSADVQRDPVRIEVTPQSTPIERIAQRVYHVAQADKRTLLVDVLGERAMSRAIVFTRTKHRADRVADHLSKNGIAAAAIHGNKSQNARQRALAAFRNGGAQVLVATDIAARGIDVDDVSHVVNFELPNEPESYVHRIGRTARAGASGIAISFCDPSERAFLRDIEKLTKVRLEAVGEAREGNAARVGNDDPAPAPAPKRPRRRNRRGGGRRAA